MAGPAPIQGIQVLSNPEPELTPEQRYGGTADPRHSSIGEVARPYSWEGVYEGSHGPYGLDNQLLGVEICSFAAGDLGQDPTADLTPRTHAAPWPKGVPQSPHPEAQAEWRDQENSIHASNTGVSRRMLYSPTLHAQQDNWQGFYEVAPGTSAQDPNVPKQVGFAVGGWGSRDRSQSLAGQNQYGFDSAHSMRRYAAGSIPGNYMWMRPGGRPMFKTLAGSGQLPTGSDSPFYGQDASAAFGVQGGILTDLPYEYATPPIPAVASAAPNQAPAEIALW